MDAKIIDEIRTVFFNAVQDHQYDSEINSSIIYWAMVEYFDDLPSNVIVTSSEREQVVEYAREYVRRLNALEEIWINNKPQRELCDALFDFRKWVTETEFVSGEFLVTMFHEECVLIGFWEEGYKTNWTSKW